jgi:hypothetical protein
MVHAEKMKHCGVEVMHAHLVVGRAVSDFIGRTVCGAALDSPPAIQILKPEGPWSRPAVGSGAWAIGNRPNSPPHNTNVESSRPPSFRSWTNAAAG